jgi:uncharacterized protein
MSQPLFPRGPSSVWPGPLPLTLLVASVVTLAFAESAAAQVQAPPTGPVIVTRGQATVKRAPDQAWVTIVAESRASTPTEAQRLSADGMTAVRNALVKAALPPDAVKTTGYSLQPDLEWSNGRSRVRGYVVRNEIEVRVDNLDKVSTVIDAAGASGATSMSGLRFDLKDRAGAEREALKLAVEDAMGRARALSAGASVNLGNIVRIEEQVEGIRPVPYMTMAARADPSAQAPTPVSPGEVGIQATVTLTVAIK